MSRRWNHVYDGFERPLHVEPNFGSTKCYSWIAVGVSVGSAVLGAGSERSAANARRRAAEAAIGGINAGYDDAEEYLDPRFQQEQDAMGRVNSLLGLGGEADYSGFRDSPGYQFQLEQGQQAIERSAAARGGLQSGNTLAEITRYSQGLADTTFNNYLAQVMGLQSQGVDFARANLATERATNIGNYLTGAGEARASGITGAANSLIAGAGSVSDIWQRRQGYTSVK
jgi:hypothetical protein